MNLRILIIIKFGKEKQYFFPGGLFPFYSIINDLPMNGFIDAIITELCVELDSCYKITGIPVIEDRAALIFNTL